LEIGLELLQVIKELFGQVDYQQMGSKQRLVCIIFLTFAALERGANSAENVGGADFVAKVWDETGVCLTTLPHQHIVRTVDLSTNASHLLTGGNEKRLRIWDLTHSTPLQGVVELKSSSGEALAHAGTIRSAFWNNRNDTIISMGEDRTIKFFDLRTLQESQRLEFSSSITSMEKSHDGELVSITTGNEVIFLNLET
jgi:serine-threonine kinase receptor-associated protein